MAKWACPWVTLGGVCTVDLYKALQQLTETMSHTQRQSVEQTLLYQNLREFEALDQEEQHSAPYEILVRAISIMNQQIKNEVQTASKVRIFAYIVRLLSYEPYWPKDGDFLFAAVADSVQQVEPQFRDHIGDLFQKVLIQSKHVWHLVCNFQNKQDVLGPIDPAKQIDILMTAANIGRLKFERLLQAMNPSWTILRVLRKKLADHQDSAPMIQVIDHCALVRQEAFLKSLSGGRANYRYD